MIDSGIGIKEENKTKLFKLFGFVSDSAHMNTSGIGLGLVISSQIVEQFEGSIKFESKFGKGSTFSFKVKLGQASEVEAEEDALLVKEEQVQVN